MTIVKDFFGVDVSKDWIDVHRLSDGWTHRYEVRSKP